MTKRVHIFVLFLIVALPVAAVAESLTLTTYYPPPSSAYDQLKLAPRGAAPVCNHGTMYVSSGSGNLEFCQSDGTWTGGGSPQWTRNGINLYVTDVTLNTGVGLSNPAYKLDVGGTLRAGQFIGDGMLPTGMVAMFTGGCPAGWGNYGPINGLFPRGSGSYGGTGGVAIHSHRHDHYHGMSGLNNNFTTASTGDHTHDVDTDHSHDFAGATDATPHQCHNDDWENDHDQACNNHLHAFNGTTWGMNGGGWRTTGGASIGDHNHTVNVDLNGADTNGPDNDTTTSGNNIPPYLDIVFCQRS